MKTRLLMLMFTLLAGVWILDVGLDRFFLSWGTGGQGWLELKRDYAGLFILGEATLVIAIAVLVFYRLVSSQQDTLERLGATHAALQDSQARFQKMTANVPGVVFQFAIRPDESWVFTFVSDKCRDLFGVEAEAIQRDSSLVFGFVHPDDLVSMIAAIEEAARRMQPWQWHGRFLVCGTCKWLRGAARPERRPDGSVLFDGLIIDITELKQAEQALARSNQMLQLVLDTIPSAVFWKDRDSVYLGCNRVFAQDAGLADTAAIVRKTDLDLVWREQASAFHADDRQVMDSNTPKFSYDEPLVKADRSRHWLRTSKVPMRDGEGQVIGVLGTYEDVTERKAAEDRLHASLREKEVLLKEIHHRVKNNLQVVSSLLRLQAGQILDPRDLRVFEESQSRVRAMGMIHESLYQSGDLAQTRFAEYLRLLADDLLHAYRTCAVDLRLEVASQIRLGIDLAIPCALIIHELVTNALKYAFVSGAVGGKPPQIRIAFEESPGGEYRLEVSDNGGGLPEIAASGQKETLGWSLVRALTEQLHGRLAIDRGGGTAVRIVFPRATP